MPRPRPSSNARVSSSIRAGGGVPVASGLFIGPRPAVVGTECQEQGDAVRPTATQSVAPGGQHIPGVAAHQWTCGPRQPPQRHRGGSGRVIGMIQPRIHDDHVARPDGHALRRDGIGAQVQMRSGAGQETAALLILQEDRRAKDRETTGAQGGGVKGCMDQGVAAPARPRVHRDHAIPRQQRHPRNMRGHDGRKRGRQQGLSQTAHVIQDARPASTTPGSRAWPAAFRWARGSMGCWACPRICRTLTGGHGQP